MSRNLPTITATNFTAGPAVVYIGAAGATPATDVGSVEADSITYEIENDIGDIMQGNPKMIVARYSKMHGIKLKVTAIEQNNDMLLYALGAGATATGGTYTQFSFGGEPCFTELALHIQHYMCKAADTLNLYMWKAVGDGVLSGGFTDDHHKYPYGFTGMYSATDWAGSSLSVGSRLFRVYRQTS
jgi:hypothetical protein